jgi:hypothetical protein
MSLMYLDSNSDNFLIEIDSFYDKKICFLRSLRNQTNYTSLLTLYVHSKQLPSMT